MLKVKRHRTVPCLIWSKGFKGISVPAHMYAWGIKDYIGLSPSNLWKYSANKIYGATKEADIAEADVYYNNGLGYSKTSEAYWYKYFDGISNCYKNAKSDPYYDEVTKTRNKKHNMSDWLGAKLK